MMAGILHRGREKGKDSILKPCRLCQATRQERSQQYVMMPLWLHSPSQNLAIEGIHDVHFAFYHAQHALAIIRKAKSRKRGCVVSLIADLRTGKGRSNDNSGSVILIVCCLYALSHYTCSPCPTSHGSSCALKYCAMCLSCTVSCMLLNMTACVQGERKR